MNTTNNHKSSEESIVSTIKAISKIDKLDISFGLENANFSNLDQNSFKSKTIHLPRISNLQNARAFGDLAALYLKFHNNALHQGFGNSDSPQSEGEESKNLFDIFEKMRVIHEGSKYFKGAAENLGILLSEDLEKINDHSFLPYLLLENPLLQDRIDGYQKIIGKDLTDKIAQLKKLTNDQESFALKVLEIIDFLNNEQDSPEKTDEDLKDEEGEDQESKPNEDESTQNEENVEQEIQIDKSKSFSEGASEDKKEAKIFEEIPQEVLSGQQIEDLGRNDSKLKFVDKYKIFTKKFDQIIRAEDLMSKADAADLRVQLDLKIKKLNRISKQLTAKLKRKLLAKKQIFFEFDKEEGLLDQKKIAQIIARPLSKNNYLTVQENDYQNTILSILIDNSGSMRGTPIVMSAMAAEIIAGIFEGFGIKTEILGFTTVDWRGGKARKLWEESGRPKNPGRLSDLRHIIYKNANSSLKKSRNNLGLMLKDGTLKENIDGEALVWATNRLKNRAEKRKILLVISDGTPVDDATNSNNDNNILNDHLHQTITHLEKHSNIEIAAIGIGHNVGDFYQNSITIKNIEELGDVMVNKICDLL